MSYTDGDSTFPSHIEWKYAKSVNMRMYNLVIMRFKFSFQCIHICKNILIRWYSDKSSSHFYQILWRCNRGIIIVIKIKLNFTMVDGPVIIKDHHFYTTSPKLSHYLGYSVRFIH